MISFKVKGVCKSKSIDRNLAKNSATESKELNGFGATSLEEAQLLMSSSLLVRYFRP